MDKNRKNTKSAFTIAEKRHSEANAEESPFWRCFGFHPQHDRLAAFTFAELMVSLVIISVITALLYPIIANIAPNNNKQLYRSAYKTVESVMQDIIEAESNNTFNYQTVPDCVDNNNDEVCDNQADINNVIDSNSTLCREFKTRLNTVRWTVPGGAPSEGCDNDAPLELHTSNGMRWWFQNCINGTCTIYVDVNASNNGDNFNSVACNTDNCAAGDVACTADCADPFDDPANFGTNGSWTKGCFRQHDDNGRDTFKIEVQSNGRINPAVDQIGIRHLRNESSDQQQ